MTEKPPMPTQTPGNVALEQRMLASQCGDGSVGRTMANEAAATIERLIWERNHALRWAHESIQSVQDALFPCRDALEPFAKVEPFDHSPDDAQCGNLQRAGDYRRARAAFIAAGGDL